MARLQAIAALTAAARTTGLFLLGALLCVPTARAEQVCSVPGECLAKVGAGAVSTSACQLAWSRYRLCLEQRAAAAPDPAPLAGECSAEDARQVWVDLRESADVDELRLFARRCKGSIQADLAAHRADKLSKAAASKPPRPSPPHPSPPPPPLRSRPPQRPPPPPNQTSATASPVNGAAPTPAPAARAAPR